MRRPPLPRPGIADRYWRFAAERQAILERRLAGAPPPWTDDPILRRFKFCNAYRAADRVSQVLIHEVAYHGEPCTPQDRLFQVVAFRIFSRPATWRGVRELLGRSPTLEDLARGAFGEALDRVRERTGGLYTGAFILCAADSYGQGRKHRNHVELFRHMFLTDGLGDRLLEARSLRAVYELIHRYPLMGDFMSYQVAIDLNYTDLLDFDENDFTRAGPGALRGIRKAFLDPGEWSPDDVIHRMVEAQQREFERLGLAFHGLGGRPLHAVDCQALFCELDKYCRVAAPELASGRRRIKARFTPSPEPLSLFLPPKWGITPGAASPAPRP